MRISIFLPHVGVFGGVRRFIELGNAWVARGNAVTLYHPDGQPPEWLRFEGSVGPLDAAANHSSDLAVCADSRTFAAFRNHRARTHLYYCVLEGDQGLEQAMAQPDVFLAANSSALRRTIARRSGRLVLD
ncbi:MAG: hypothetical protein ACRD1T_09910, partial [Acidimicrobiia bacterium]